MFSAEVAVPEILDLVRVVYHPQEGLLRIIDF
jgi:hypothetical protein